MQKKSEKTPVVCFKRWTRQNFAVFSSLKKMIVISGISLGCSFVAKPVSGVAQTLSDSVIHHPLDELQVIGEEEPSVLSLDRALLQISVSSVDIARTPASALNELLDYLPGVDIRQRGAWGTQADLSYRGGNFDQTMILLNGINFTDPQTGHYALHLPVTPKNIHHIELYNNSTSFLFGHSPFSGALNVITRPDTSPAIGFYLEGGMYGLLNAGTALHLRAGKTRHLLTADYSHAGGYRHNTDFTIGNAFYQMMGNFKQGELLFQAGYVDKDYGANGFYSLKYPDQHERTRTFLTSVQWKNKGKIKWSPSIYYRGNEDCFELTKGQDPRKNNYHYTQVAGTNFLFAFHTRAGYTSFCADARVEDVLSTSLGKSLENPVPVLFRDDSLFYRQRLTRLNAGLSVAQQYVYRGLRVGGTLLLQYFTSTQQKIYVLPAAYISYRFKTHETGQVNMSEKLSISASGAVRQPTFTDLYYKTGDILGNDNLNPEQAYTLEGAIELQWNKNHYHAPFLLFSTAIFHRWGFQMIDYVKKDNEQMWNTVNHTAIRFWGIESSIEFLPREYFGKNFLLSSINLQYSYLYSDKESQGYQSRYVLDHLTHVLTLRVSHAVYKDLSINYGFSYRQRKGEYTSYQQSTEGTPAAYPAGFLLDARLNYHYKIMDIYIEASNLLNQRYFDLGDLEQPGIWARIGIKGKLFLK